MGLHPQKAKRKTRDTTLRRLPLASLRVFVIAAEELNFSRAGASLGLSTAAVSMQVRALEEYLGVQLFQRAGRRVTLSSQGAAFLPRVRKALEDMESAIEALRHDHQTGHVTVSMLASFLQQWMIPRLPGFQTDYPQVDLRIETSRDLVDFLRSDVQMAIRLGSGKYSNLHVDKLFDEWWVVVGVPRLIQKHGFVRDMEDIQRFPLLHSSSEPWEHWSVGYAKDVWAKTGSTLDDSAAVVQAAVAGHGLALCRWSLVENEVSTGKLVIASNKVTCTNAYYLVCPPANLETEKCRAFRAWILEQAKTFRPPQDFFRAELKAAAVSTA